MYISDSDSDNDSDIEQYDDMEEAFALETASIASSSTNDPLDYDSDSGSESIIIDDMNNNSDSDSDSDEEPEYITEIFQEDSGHLYMDKTNNEYYIGFCKPMHRPCLILMANSVSPTTFFHHSYERICQYLQHYSSLMLRTPKLEIMQLHITDDEIYSIVIKTHWLRLVQRNWKRVFRERKEIIRRRMTIESLKTYELTSKFPYGLRTLPGLNGMMSVYRNLERAAA